MARLFRFVLWQKDKITVSASRQEDKIFINFESSLLRRLSEIQLYDAVGERTFDIIVLHHKKEFSSECIYGGIPSSSLCCQ